MAAGAEALRGLCTRGRVCGACDRSSIGLLLRTTDTAPWWWSDVLVPRVCENCYGDGWERQGYDSYRIFVPEDFLRRAQRAIIAGGIETKTKYNTEMSILNSLATLPSDLQIAMMRVGLHVLHAECRSIRVIDDWSCRAQLMRAFEKLFPCCRSQAMLVATPWQKVQPDESLAVEIAPDPSVEVLATSNPPESLPEGMTCNLTPMEIELRCMVERDQAWMAEPLGRQIAPVIGSIEHHTRTLSSMMSSAGTRFGEAMKPFTLRPEEVERLHAVVKAIKKKLTPTFIWDCVYELTLDDFMSNAWTTDRRERAVAQHETADRLQLPEAQVKHNEYQKLGKKARWIINCGDLRQLTILAVTKTLEKAFFKKFHRHSVKGYDKQGAALAVIRDLQRVCLVLTGDGKRWDSTMSLRLRLITEKPLQDHVYDVIGDFSQERADMYGDEMRRRYNRKSAWVTKFKGDCSKGLDAVTVTWRNKFNVRESGSADTSLMNAITNLCLWSACLGGPCVLEDRIHTGAWCHVKVEGDDSVVGVEGPPPGPNGYPVTDESWIPDFFNRAGLNFKLDICYPKIDSPSGSKHYDKFTFIGIDFLYQNGACGPWCPTIPRNLYAASMVKCESVNPEVDRLINYYALVGRAVPFLYHCRTVARYFLACAAFHRPERATLPPEAPRKFVEDLKRRSLAFAADRPIEELVADLLPNEPLEHDETVLYMLSCGNDIDWSKLDFLSHVTVFDPSVVVDILPEAEAGA